MVDYSKLSTEDLINLRNGNYSNVSTEGLLLLRGNQQPQKERNSNPITGFAKGAVQGLTSLPNAMANEVFNKRVRPMIGKKPLTDEELAQKSWVFAKPQTGAEKTGYLVGNIAPTLALPEIKIAQGAGLGAKALNTGLTGTYQGGLVGASDSLINNGDFSGIGAGAGIGGVIGAGIPLVGASMKPVKWLGDQYYSKIAQLKPKTIEQAIKPNSRALDLTEDEAENLLMNTTESVRNNYNNLLKQRGQAISEAEEALRNNTNRIDANNVLDDITNVFNQGQGEKVNTVRDLTGNLEDDLLGLVANSADEAGTIAPIDLQRIKQEVGQMTNWADTTRPKIQNTTLEQIYGKMNERLLNLSPELAEANANYAQLKNFQNNEGLKRILRPGDNIDSASSALKNYNSTVTKGNTNRNIQDLENVLVNEGYEPFLANIDDVNAANELLKSPLTGINESGKLDIAKMFARVPLRISRKLNRLNVPQTFNNTIMPYTQQLLPVTSVSLYDRLLRE